MTKLPCLRTWIPIWLLASACSTCMAQTDGVAAARPTPTTHQTPAPTTPAQPGAASGSEKTDAAEQQPTAGTQQGSPTVPAPGTTPLPAPRKTHRVRKVILITLFVGVLVLSGLGGAFRD